MTRTFCSGGETHRPACPLGRKRRWPTWQTTSSSAFPTFWEIVVKGTTGKLQFPDDLAQVVKEERFELLPISLSHLSALGDLPMLHRDPFDRMLVAQALAEGLPLITGDRALRPYPVAISGNVAGSGAFAAAGWCLWSRNR